MRLLQALSVIVIAALLVSASAAEQILQDDFNDGTLGPFHAANYGEGEYTVEVVEDAGREGTPCLRMKNDSPAAGCAAVYTVQYERGRIYTITYWARAVEGEARIQAYLDVGDWRLEYPGGYSPRVTVGEEWTKLAHSNLHMQGGRSYAANIKAGGRAPVLVDDVEIRKSDGLYAINWALAEHGGTPSADSFYSGYRSQPINDGLQAMIGSDFTRRATATSESSSPHWVQVSFPAPRPVSRVVIYWAAEGGKTYTSEKFEVQLEVEGQWQTVAGVTDRKPEMFSVFEFDQQPATAVRIMQPAGGGSQARPNLMWVSEVEAY